MRALAAVFFLAVCAYLGAGLFGGLGNSTRTCSAELVRLTESTRLQGIAVRREQPVCSPEDAEITAANGKRLPRGATIAVFGDENIVSGYSALFFSDTDGFEQLSPDMLLNLTAEKLNCMMGLKGEKTDAIGRLVPDHAWYFAAFAEGRLPEEGESCRVIFDGLEQSVDAKAVLSNPEEKLLVLRINHGNDELYRLRKCGAELVFSEYTGLKLPKEALMQDSDGNYFVYTLTAGLKESCAVDIIYTGDDFYLAAISPAADSLRAGSTLIIPEQEIYTERIPEKWA